MPADRRPVAAANGTLGAGFGFASSPVVVRRDASKTNTRSDRSTEGLPYVVQTRPPAST